MSAPVFVCPAAADAVAGSRLALTGAEGRHAVTVQRRTVGEPIDLVDGCGVRASGSIVEVGQGELVMVVERISRDIDPHVTLVQALAKAGRDEQAVEAAVELGATAVIPWAAQRSIVQWKAAKAEKGREGWAQVVLAAAKQSRRALVPTVEQVHTTAQLARWTAAAVAGGTRVLVLHESAKNALTSLTWDAPDTPVAVVVGPEGGISDAELEALADAGAEAVVLGPHVLRASSAGPAAIAALAGSRGTWGRVPTTLGT